MGVYKDMISYYTPLLGPLKSMAGQNTSQFLGGSILSAVSLEAVAVFLDLIFRCYSWNDCNSWIFIIMDWWTGSAASHTKAIIARNKGDG
jgi:hypothetical protein